MPDSRVFQTGGLYFPQPELRLAAKLDDYLHSLADSIQHSALDTRLCVVLLAGGYGRGEGGIFRSSPDAEPQLYNDLEFYLILRDGADAGPVERWCEEQSHRGDEALGIEVEFKILREGAFRAAQPSMFYYDLLAAHRVVFGPPEFAQTVPERLHDPSLIPLHEAARLLFNRGTGLFFSAAALHAGDARETDGFVERNHAKVRLALADAVLASQGRYHFSCLERHRRLCEAPVRSDLPPDWSTLVEWHGAGVEFKLNPRHRHPSAPELKRTQETLSQVWMRTFLWLESRRLNVPLSSADGYAYFPGRLFPETSPFRNALLHCRDRFRRGAALRGLWDYPRAALQRALALLLREPSDSAGAARLLGLKAPASVAEIEAAYARWWRFYN